MDTFEFRSTDLSSLHVDPSTIDTPFIYPSIGTPASMGTPVIGQYFDQDLIGSTGETLNAFYESGQMWALIIGILLGYGFKSFSSYG